MGMTAVGVGMGVQALGGVFGAQSQANAQNKNTNNAQQNHDQLVQMINRQMLGGQNPYAQSYLNALQGLNNPGQGRPAGLVGNVPQGWQNGMVSYNAQQNPGGNGGQVLDPTGLGAPPPQVNFGFGGPNSGVSFDTGGPTDGGGGEGIPTEIFTYPANPGTGGQAGGNGLTGMGGQNPALNGQQGSMGPVPNFNPYNPLSSQIDPFTYNPSTLGAAPMVSGMPQVSAQQVTAPQIQGPGGFNPMQIQAPAPVGTQGMNAGQDALLQMMRANITPPNDSQLQQNLQRGVSGQAFDPSDLLKSMQTNEKTLMDQQVAGLEGSAGSLGQRFGTAMQQNEANLRQNLGSQFNQQNQQVMQTAFENAANRGQQALGLQTNYQQQLNQLPFQQAQLQQQAAQAGGGLVQQGSQLNLQAQIQNALNNLQAQQGNQQAGLQAGMQGQSIAAQLAQAQAGMGLQSGLANQQVGMQAQGMNLDSFMRSALANQQMQGQYGQANANILNQAGQYNAQAGMQAAGFNAQQGQYFNQLQQALMGQAQNAQQWQQGQNSGLIGLLAGLPLPQQQMSPWGSAISGLGGDAMTMGLLQQFMGRPSTGGAGGGQVQGGNEFMNWG